MAWKRKNGRKEKMNQRIEAMVHISDFKKLFECGHDANYHDWCSTTKDLVNSRSGLGGN